MIVENVGASCFKPRSGDINISCLSHFNAFSSDLAIRQLADAFGIIILIIFQLSIRIIHKSSLNTMAS